MFLYTYKEVLNMNNKAKAHLNKKFALKVKSKYKANVYGGYIIIYDDYISLSEEQAPLGNIIDLISSGERYISNCSSLAQILN